MTKKNSTKRRVILDLSTLNTSILCPTFRMTTLQEVRALLPENAFTTSIDMKDAYWHVPVHPYFRKFLGFAIGGTKYRFRAMPFGLNVAPRIFTKICRPILKELRQRGINLVVYLDDWLIWGRTEKECQEATDIVLEVLMRRGFLINWGKSRLVPSRQFQWLGVFWNTASATLSLPLDKVTSLTRDLLGFLSRTFITRRQLEQILGKLQFASLVDPVGKALLKGLNSFLRSKARKGARDSLYPFPLPLRRSLRRWLRPGVLRSVIPFRPPPPTMDIFTDASLSGWGVHTSDGQMLQGTWSGPLARVHINILELVTVFLALKRLVIPSHSHVRLHSDNSTVVACLNRHGSAKSIPLNSWTLSILRIMSRKNLSLTAFHIAGVRNVLADALSRSTPVASEWMLDRLVFRDICDRWGTPEVDLFATRENAQVPTFVSPIPDHLAVAVDAFSIPWDRWDVIYLFPPTKLLMRVLSVLESFHGRAILITPDWPGQSWYPLLQTRSRDSLLIQSPGLSQLVGRHRFFSSSKVFRQLRCWTL